MNLLIKAISFDTMVIDSNQTNTSYIICDFTDLYRQTVLGYLDLSNRVIMPSILMVLFTILIILAIFYSRKKVSSSIQNNNRLKKDIRFAILSIILNIVYILLSLPVSIVVLFPDYSTNQLYILVNYLYFAAYMVNFFLMISINSLFRSEFIDIFVPSRISIQRTLVDRDPIQMHKFKSR